ncbi:MAG: hypothetical protein ACRELY_12455 [Polyangiaceae bacterium]
MLLPALGIALVPAVARGADQAHDKDADEKDDSGVPKDFPKLVLDDGRTEIYPAEKHLVRFQIHGEYQLRYQTMSSFPLDVSTSVLQAHPNATADSLGQNNFVTHWIRFTPRLQVRDNVQIIGQIDLVTGLVLGDRAHDVSAGMTPRDDYNGFSNVQPRWLYADLTTKIGVFRVGQQPSHWGMGILANDGDHASLFGDYRYGDISERVLFATKPLGKESPFIVVVAGDLVYRDQNATLTRGDQAFQGVFAAIYDQGQNQLGLYGVYRDQRRDQNATDFSSYTDKITVGVLDAAGKFAAPVVYGSDTYVFGQAEAATILGSTNELRTNAQALSGDTTAIRSYGGAAALGVVHATRGCCCNGECKDADVKKWGDFVGQVELGYASGDADPYDGTEHRFTFNPNHKVGLILFDEVMRWQTARAATAAQDPLLANSNRPPPGIDLLPSNGGVFGAQYINPTFLFRPRKWLDLKAGMVIAQATADVVDPLRIATQGSYVNYRGGDPHRHDLGEELDLGTEVRVPLEYKLTLQLGAQGGVLFPGGALADAMGAGMKTPWLAIGRAGLQF